jgi:hypothetical protein
MAYPPSWFWPDNRAEDASVPIGVEAHSACTAFGAATIDPAETQCDAHALTRREMKSMDKEKEGVLGTISDAAKTSMEATVEGVSSAATNIVAAVTGISKKPRRPRKRSTAKKAAAGRRRTATGRGKAKRSSARRTRSAAGTRR